MRHPFFGLCAAGYNWKRLSVLHLTTLLTTIIQFDWQRYEEIDDAPQAADLRYY